MSNSQSLVDVLFPATRQRVLAVLLLQPETGFHLRELARMTGTHAGTLGRELDKLTEAGLLRRSEQGNQMHYRANRDCPLFEDLAAIFRKTHGVVPALREALSPLDRRIELAWIFGSIARGSAHAGSDVDLLVLGEVGFAELIRAIHPLHESLRREINPVLYSVDEFRTRLRSGEAFARELIEKPKLFLKGNRSDLAELAADRPPAGARA
jgi:predicted nucleotidyltransferase